LTWTAAGALAGSGLLILRINFLLQVILSVADSAPRSVHCEASSASGSCFEDGHLCPQVWDGVGE